MSLWDRPNGPVSGAANSATQTTLNTQAAQAGPLPATQAIIATAEAKILSPENTAVALTVTLPPNTPSDEQTLIDVIVSGYIKTTASGTIALGLYGDGLATVTSGNLLHKTASAVTQNNATAPFFFHAQLIYDSVSGKLHGKAGGMINNVIDPEIALTNVLTGISNLANPVLTFSFTITSSGAASGTPTTINVQKFSVG
jgi:hypothetical protein